MSCATLQQLTDRYGARMLVAITDRAESPTGLVDPEVVARTLADTDAMIDGYLAVRYRLPLASVPALVTDLAQMIAIWKLHPLHHISCSALAQIVRNVLRGPCPDSGDRVRCQVRGKPTVDDLACQILVVLNAERVIAWGVTFAAMAQMVDQVCTAAERRIIELRRSTILQIQPVPRHHATPDTERKGQVGLLIRRTFEGVLVLQPDMQYVDIRIGHAAEGRIGHGRIQPPVGADPLA